MDTPIVHVFHLLTICSFGVATKFLRTILASYASRALCQQLEADIVTTLRLFSHIR